MTSRLHLSALAFLLSPMIALAAACDAPRFTAFVPGPFAQAPQDLVAVELAMQPVATLRLPAGFAKWGSQPHGAVVFGNHSKGINDGIAYETVETVAPHRQGTSPAEFFRAIFLGLDKAGCGYLTAWELQAQDYRLHASLGNGADLFAYGKDKRHHFYIIRQDQPDFVLNGLIKGINRAEFETILSTLQLQ